MMARYAGKTRLHNIEPEDLRSVTRATAAVTGIPLAGTTGGVARMLDRPAIRSPDSVALRFLVVRASSVANPIRNNAGDVPLDLAYKKKSKAAVIVAPEAAAR